MTTRSSIAPRSGTRVGRALAAAVLVLMTADVAGRQRTLSVLDFGAVGNGRTLDSPAINRAVEACAAGGGCALRVPPGTYLAGSIRLRNNVHLHLEEGATILGAPAGSNAYDPPEPNPWQQYQDFGHSHFHDALLWGDSVENVSITGPGMIVGGGLQRSNDLAPGDGDKAISLRLCRNVVVEDLTILQGGHFAVIATGCDGLRLRRVTIRTTRDGIDVVSSRNVEIDGCDVESVRYEHGVRAGGDDAVALKSDYALGRAVASEHIAIRNCTIASGGNAIQFGSETVGDFRDVRISNVIIRSAEKAGIGLTTSDGAAIDGVTISGVVMQQVATPIFLKVSDRGRAPGPPDVGAIRNVRISDVTATDVFGYANRETHASTVMGKPGHPIENLVLENVRLTYKGGSLRHLGLDLDPAAVVPPELDDHRPVLLGLRPGYGLYVRNVRGLALRNVSLDTEQPDPRPALVVQDAAGVMLDRVSAARAPGRGLDVLLRDVTGFDLVDSPQLSVVGWTRFRAQRGFDVPGPARPAPRDVAGRIGLEEPPILLSTLPAVVLRALSRELGVSGALLAVHVDTDIRRNVRAGRVVYSISAETADDRNVDLEIAEDGTIVTAKPDGPGR